MELAKVFTVNMPLVDKSLLVWFCSDLKNRTWFYMSHREWEMLDMILQPLMEVQRLVWRRGRMDDPQHVDQNHSRSFLIRSPFSSSLLIVCFLFHCENGDIFLIKVSKNGLRFDHRTYVTGVAEVWKNILRTDRSCNYFPVKVDDKFKLTLFSLRLSSMRIIAAIKSYILNYTSYTVLHTKCHFLFCHCECLHQQYPFTSCTLSSIPPFLPSLLWRLKQQCFTLELTTEISSYICKKIGFQESQVFSLTPLLLHSFRHMWHDKLAAYVSSSLPLTSSSPPSLPATIFYNPPTLYPQTGSDFDSIPQL